MYFPKFFHPDPSVKRQSGFLIPSLNDSGNTGASLNLPYFKVLDINKDLTIQPRIFTNNNLMLQSEYRQVFENSNLITDISYNKKDNSNRNAINTSGTARILEAIMTNDFLTPEVTGLTLCHLSDGKTTIDPFFNLKVSLFIHIIISY